MRRLTKFGVFMVVLLLVVLAGIILVVVKVNSQATASEWRRWTAPADRPLLDKVAAYDLRFSKTPIDSLTAINAESFSGVPVPSAPGARDSCLVTGLDFSTVYWFAIRSKDKAGNWSAWSNIVVDTTTDKTGPFPVLDLR